MLGKGHHSGGAPAGLNLIGEVLSGTPDNVNPIGEVLSGTPDDENRLGKCCRELLTMKT